MSTQWKIELPNNPQAVIKQKYDSTTCWPRENVSTFFYPSAKGPKANHTKRDLFIWGLQWIQGNLDPTDPWSFYQIAAIHGMPYQSYDGDKNAAWKDAPIEGKWWGGYCHHGDAVFPTWHRPYMLLLEQAIIRGAGFAVDSFEISGQINTDEANEARELAQQVRLPYIDWTDKLIEALGVPSVLLDPMVSVTFPSPQQILNPMRSYVLPHALGRVRAGETSNPAAKPYYAIPNQGTPYTPAGWTTVRYPDPNYVSNNNEASLNVIVNNTVMRSNIRSLLMQPQWDIISNHLSKAADDTEKSHKEFYGHYASIEYVHDDFHNIMGGPGGHMAYPDIAAFDPMFFFHHANVDRLTALWQHIYDPYATSDNKGDTPAWLQAGTGQKDTTGTYYEPQNSDVNGTSPLVPFAISETAWYTSNDVRNVIKDCNYTYPELTWDLTPQDLLDYLQKLYAPKDYMRMRWFVSLRDIPKMKFGGPYSIRVFIDLPDASAITSTRDPHYAGRFYIFARDTAQVACSKCKPDGTIQASIDITECMRRLDIVTDVQRVDGNGYPMIWDNLTDEHVVFDAAEKIAETTQLYPDSFTFVFVRLNGEGFHPNDYAPKPIISWKMDRPLHSTKLQPAQGAEATLQIASETPPNVTDCLQDTQEYLKGVELPETGKRVKPWGVRHPSRDDKPPHIAPVHPRPKHHHG